MSDSDEETPTDHQLKFVLLGDGASGKVSFVVTEAPSVDGPELVSKIERPLILSALIVVHIHI